MARPWFLERRYGLARGIYYRLVADGRYAGKQFLSEVQFRLDAMQLSSGFSSYQLVFGSNPVDNYGWRDGGGDLLVAQDTFLSGQFAPEWKLRMLAQDAALKEVDNSKLRRLLAVSRSF